MMTITIRNSAGETIVLGKGAEFLLLYILSWSAKSKFSPLTENEQEEARNLLEMLK